MPRRGSHPAGENESCHLGEMHVPGKACDRFCAGVVSAHERTHPHHRSGRCNRHDAAPPDGAPERILRLLDIVPPPQEQPGEHVEAVEADITELGVSKATNEALAACITIDTA